MPKTVQPTADFHAESKAAVFNFNKLQAVLCIAASAVVSIGLILWAITALI